MMDDLDILDTDNFNPQEAIQFNGHSSEQKDQFIEPFTNIEPVVTEELPATLEPVLAEAVPAAWPDLGRRPVTDERIVPGITPLTQEQFAQRPDLPTNPVADIPTYDLSVNARTPTKEQAEKFEGQAPDHKLVYSPIVKEKKIVPSKKEIVSISKVVINTLKELKIPKTPQNIGRAVKLAVGEMVKAG